MGFNNSLYVLPKKFFLKIVLEVQYALKRNCFFLNRTGLADSTVLFSVRFRFWAKSELHLIQNETWNSIRRQNLGSQETAYHKIIFTSMEFNVLVPCKTSLLNSLFFIVSSSVLKFNIIFPTESTWEKKNSIRYINKNNVLCP